MKQTREGRKLLQRVNNCNWFDNMINNYRSRSFSFRSFKQSRAGAAAPSLIFTPAKRRDSSEGSYLGISYASPQQYYTNCPKNGPLARLECRRSPPSRPAASLPPTPTHHHSNPPNDPHAQEQSTQPGEQRHRCLFKYFANLAEQERRDGSLEERPKSKSILLIRKINKKKEEVAERARQRLEDEFRKRKQVPIHHTQFHFHTRRANTEHSPPQRTHNSQKTEFKAKIHRAVEEILKLRATLADQPQQPTPQQQEQNFRGIIIEGNLASPEQRLIPLSKSIKFTKPKAKPRKTAEERQEEIGPWPPVSNDLQFLF